MDWFWRRNWGKKNYLMNKGFFFLLSFLILVTFAYALMVTNGDDSLNIFLSCPGDLNCKNPLFNSSDCGVKIPANSSYCTMPVILAGSSLGSPPPFIYTYFWFIIVLEAFFVLGLNHWLFNRGFFKGMRLE